MRYIGIDPGKAGGIACVTASSGAVAVKMPESDRDILDLLRRWVADEDGSCFAMLEKVHSSPQMGVASAFTFGQGWGRLRMALAAAWIPFDLVSPQAWQKALGCRTGGNIGAKVAADKGITKRRAQELFPHLTVTHAIADALLLAEYCRRVKTGQANSPAVRPAAAPQRAGTSLF